MTEARSLRELLEGLGDPPVRFWVCPIAEHGERKGAVTVEWRGGTAHCTFPGCGRHS